MEKTAKKQDQVVVERLLLITKEHTSMSYVSLLLLLPERYTQRVFSIYFLYKPACEPFDVPPCTCDIRWFASLFLFLKDLLILIWFFRNWNFQKAEHALDVQGWHSFSSDIFSRSQRDHKLLKQIFLLFLFPSITETLTSLPMLLTWNQIKWNLYKKKYF